MGRVSEKTAPRPAQVTIAAGLVMVGSVFVVLAAFDQIAGLHTLDTRQAVEEFLDQDPGRSLGLDVQGTLTLMRVLTMVTAACATAAAILGYHVLRRSRPARLVLSVLAVPLFLGGFVVGGFIPAMVVGAITMLWFQPARDWVDGKAPRPVPDPPAPVVAPPPPPPPTSGPGWGSSEPRPVSGFGDRTSTLLASLPPPRTAPIGAAATTLPAHRPPALRMACILAWVGSGLAAFTMLASIAVIVSAPDVLMDELESSGVTLDELRGPVLYGCVVMTLWALTAIVIAGYAWAGRAWAWTSLLVSSVSAAVLCLFGMVGNPVAILPLSICVAATILLLRAEVRAYFR